MGGVHWLKSKSEWRTFLPSHEPSFGARPVPGRSSSDSLLVPEPSPSRRLHSGPLRAGTSRAPDAGGFRGARRDKSSERSLPALPARRGEGLVHGKAQNTCHARSEERRVGKGC